MEKLEKLFDPRIIEKVKNLRLMDDDLMTRVFSEDIEATELLLRILLNNSELKVLESHGQHELRNIFGRSIKLDILAEDSKHNLINVEIQRSDKGAAPRRTRYHAAMLDSHFLKKNDDFTKLKDTYIIFITEKDIWQRKLPVYKIHKEIEGTDLPFIDGLNILYVDGEYRGKDPLGDLMHDFNCTDPGQMKYQQLARKVKYYKQESEGVKTMCKAVEDYGKEIEKETKEKIITEMLKGGKLAIEEIAAYSNLSVEEVKAISQKLSA